MGANEREASEESPNQATTAKGRMFIFHCLHFYRWAEGAGEHLSGAIPWRQASQIVSLQQSASPLPVFHCCQSKVAHWAHA